MSALNLPRWQFIIAGCPRRDPNLVMSLICLTSHALSAKSTLLPLTQTHSWFICASYPVYVIHHAIGLFSPPSPLCGVSGTEVILYSSESKHCLRCGAFKLFCFFSKLYACECSSGDPHTPFPTNSTTNDIPLLASIQYTAWENTTGLEKGGRTHQSGIWAVTNQFTPHLFGALSLKISVTSLTSTEATLPNH